MKKKISLLILSLVALLPANADEGMWTLYNLPPAVFEQMKAEGFALPVVHAEVDYKALAKDAKTVHDITLTLSKILEGMPTDCGHCALKPVCDEVEGMKELHFGKNKKA